MAVTASVTHPTARRGYRTDYRGKPRIGLGMSGVKYNVKVGDSSYGFSEEDHIEPGLSIYNKESREESAVSVLSCIGNKVTVVSGDAKGAEGYITGKHGNFMVWFPEDAQDSPFPRQAVGKAPGRSESQNLCLHQRFNLILRLFQFIRENPVILRNSLTTRL